MGVKDFAEDVVICVDRVKNDRDEAVWNIPTFRAESSLTLMKPWIKLEELKYAYSTLTSYGKVLKLQLRH